MEQREVVGRSRLSRLVAARIGVLVVGGGDLCGGGSPAVFAMLRFRCLMPNLPALIPSSLRRVVDRVAGVGVHWLSLGPGRRDADVILA